jgi:pentapeptide MXKDX repeat protein
MKRIGTAALAVGMTLAIASAAVAQTGRDTPQSGAGMDSTKSGTMNKGTMQKDNMQKNNMQNDNMQKGNMEKGSSGTMSK